MPANQLDLVASTSNPVTKFPSYINIRELCYNNDDDNIVRSGFKKVNDSCDNCDGTAFDINPSNGGALRFRNPIRQIGTAYFDYTAKENDEISLKRGSLVEIINSQCGEDGWILARVDNKKGMVPKNYVFLVGDQPKVVDGKDVQRTNLRIGTGGFADVFRGCFNAEAVALKIPRHHSKVKETKILEALEREALIFCRLKHKNIVGFYGISLNPLFLVLELCEGGTLFSLCRKMKSCHAPTTVYWAKQVALAMHHLHSRDDPLVHADLKADNVLIKERPCECGLLEASWKKKLINQYNREGVCQKCNGHRLDCLTLKITDFGLSRSLKSRRESFSGSVPWMPPEVIEKNEYSKQSDVWSFGVFLWEIFSCKIPFSNYDYHVVMFAIVKRDKTLHLPENCMEELKAIFRCCWKKKAIERASFSHILVMLEFLESKITDNFTWCLKEDEENQKTPTEETVSFKEIERQFKEGKLFGSLQSAQNSFAKRLLKFQKPPMPAARSHQCRRFGKNDIGGPIDFRHNISVRPQIKDCKETANMFGSEEKMFVVKYSKPEEKNDDEDKLSCNAAPKNNLLQAKEIHRSYNALNAIISPVLKVNMSVESKNKSNKKIKCDNSSYMTLPRNYKHFTVNSSTLNVKSENYFKMWNAIHNLVKQDNNHEIYADLSDLNVNNNYSPLSENFNFLRLPNSISISNPEFVTFGIADINIKSKFEMSIPIVKPSLAGHTTGAPRIKRNSDYVTLKYDGFCGDAQIGRKYKNWNKKAFNHQIELDKNVNDEVGQKNANSPYVYLQDRNNSNYKKVKCDLTSDCEGKYRSLERANAFRRKLLTTLSSRESANSNLLNLGSFSSHVNDKKLINEIPSPENVNFSFFMKTESSSSPSACSTLQAPIVNLIESDDDYFPIVTSSDSESLSFHSSCFQKSSGNSHFYVYDCNNIQDTDSTLLCSLRQRSGNKKIMGGLLSKVSNMFMPSTLIQDTDFNCSNDTDLNISVVEHAICHHPHHLKDRTKKKDHCCLLGTQIKTLLSPTADLPLIDINSMISYQPPLVSRFIKRSEYPEHQRQRHRTESSVSGFMTNAIGISNAFTVTDLDKLSSSINSLTVNSSLNSAQQNISVATIIELQNSLFLNDNGTALRQNFPMCFSGLMSPFRHDILNRPIKMAQSFNDLSLKKTSSNNKNSATFVNESKINSFNFDLNASHHRSKSSDNPSSCLRKKLIFSNISTSEKLENEFHLLQINNENNATAYNLHQRAHVSASLLAERLAQPVPTGLVMNHSYVPMNDSIYHTERKKGHFQVKNSSNGIILSNNNNCLTAVHVPPLLLKRSSIAHQKVDVLSQTYTKKANQVLFVSNQNNQVCDDLNSSNTNSTEQELAWPTSNAPVLGKCDFCKSSLSTSSQKLINVNHALQRPNTLNLKRFHQNRYSSTRLAAKCSIPKSQSMFNDLDKCGAKFYNLHGNNFKKIKNQVINNSYNNNNECVNMKNDYYEHDSVNQICSHINRKAYCVSEHRGMSNNYIEDIKF